MSKMFYLFILWIFEILTYIYEVLFKNKRKNNQENFGKNLQDSGLEQSPPYPKPTLHSLSRGQRLHIPSLPCASNPLPSSIHGLYFHLYYLSLLSS